MFRGRMFLQNCINEPENEQVWEKFENFLKYCFLIASLNIARVLPPGVSKSGSQTTAYRGMPIYGIEGESE